jgi:hypothetical protein
MAPAGTSINEPATLPARTFCSAVIFDFDATEIALADASVRFWPNGFSTGAAPFCARIAFWKRLSEMEPAWSCVSVVRAFV